MASVINSARTSTVSAFDMATSVFDTAGKLVSTAARTVNALDAKAKTLTENVEQDEKLKRIRNAKETKARHVLEHKQFMDDIASQLTEKSDLEDYNKIQAEFDQLLSELD